MFTHLCQNAQVIKEVCEFSLKSKVYFNFNSIYLQTLYNFLSLNIFFLINFFFY